MGITDKIQQKLSGNNSNQAEEERRLEQEQGSQWTRGAHEQYNSPQTTHVQHPIASQDARSGIVGGTALEHGGYGSDALNRDPTDTRFGGSTANPLTSTTGTHHVGGTTGTHHVGGTTGTHHVGSTTGPTGTTGLSNSTGLNNATGTTGLRGNNNSNYNDNARSGIVGGTALEGGLGSDALNRRDHADVSSTSDKLRDTHLGGTTGGTTGTTTGIGSTTGNTYSASHDRGAVGDVGSRRDADHPEVRRTAGGGISNGGTDFISGPQHKIENYDAIPVAGGQKVGGVGDDYDHSSSGPGPAPNTSGPHRSDLLNKMDPRVTADPSKRDDVGFTDNRHGHNTTGTTTTSGITGTTHDSSIDRRAQGTHAGTYGQDVSYNNRANVNEPLTGSKDFNDRHHHGHTGAGVGTAAGVGAGAGALASSGHHHDHYNNNSHLGSSGLPTTTNTSSQRAAGVDSSDMGSQLAKRMGGAYEAGYKDGYRDAEEHHRRRV